MEGEMKIIFVTADSVNRVWQERLTELGKQDLVVFGFNGLGLVNYKKENWLRKFTCGNKRLESTQDALIRYQALNCCLHHTLFASLLQGCLLRQTFPTYVLYNPLM